MASLGIEPQHPDEFVANLLDLHPAPVVTAVRTILKRLKHPPLTAAQLLNVYARNQLVRTEVMLREFFADESE